MSREIALFFSNGISLTNWQSKGFLDRELSLYKELNRSGWGITFYTYDRSKVLPGTTPTKVVSQWPFFTPRRFNWVYEAVMPFVRLRHGRRTDIIMTNQAYRGWPAILASRLWDCKIVARCGMVYGEQIERREERGIKVAWRMFLEKQTFRCADLCVVPTSALSVWIQARYGIQPHRVRVIPNFVDTNLFRPLESLNKFEPIDVIVVGRLNKVKRHILLLKAALGKKWRLFFIGQGSESSMIIKYAQDHQINLEILNSVPNQELPQYLSKSKIFILLSKYEGHPKALIEAMACGCACIGADSPGINNILNHGKNGMLVKADPVPVSEAIKLLLSNSALRQRLGDSARKYAVREYSLEHVARSYCSVFEELYYYNQEHSDKGIW